MSTLTNEVLAVMAQAGDMEALTELWRKTERFTTKAARRYAILFPGSFEVCDLTQEAYFGLQNAVAHWRTEDGASFLAYYKRCLQTSFSIAARRRTSRQANDPMHDALSLNAPVSDDSDASELGELLPDEYAQSAFCLIEHTELVEAVHAALNVLTAEERQIIRLRYWSGLAQEKTASALNTSTAAVKKAEASALRKLRAPAVSRKLRAFL